MNKYYHQCFIVCVPHMISTFKKRRLARLPRLLQRVPDQEADPGAVRADPGADQLAGAAHHRLHTDQVHHLRQGRGDTSVLCERQIILF